MSDQPVYRILIFCAEPNKLDSVGRFLINRGWQVQIEKSLKRAIEVIVHYSPDMVLMTVNHSKVNPDKLYPLIQQHGIRVLPFAEKTDPRTYTRLQGYPQNTVLYPPMSGPSVYRKIQLLFKAEEQDQKKVERQHQQKMEQHRFLKTLEENKHGNQASGVDQSQFPAPEMAPALPESYNAGSIPPSSGVTAPSVIEQIQRNAKESTTGSHRAPQIFSKASGSGTLGSGFHSGNLPTNNNRKSDFDLSSSQVVPSQGNTFSHHANGDQSQDPSQLGPTANQLAATLDPLVAEPAAVPLQQPMDGPDVPSLGDLFDAPESVESYSDPFADMLGIPTHNSPQGHQAKDLPGKSQSLVQSTAKARHDDFETQDRASISKLTQAGESLNLDANEISLDQARELEQKPSLGGFGSPAIKEHTQDTYASGLGPRLHNLAGEDSTTQEDSHVLKPVTDPSLSQVAQAARQALEDASNFEGPTRRLAKHAGYIDAYTVNKNGKRGVVLLSDQDGGGREDRPLEEFEAKLTDRLRQAGGSLSEVERIRLQLSESNIEEISEAAGEFTFSSINDGDEVILTYLSGDDYIPEVVEEAPQNMVGISLESFEADKAVDFEVFLFLKTNQKMYKYLKPGRSMSQKQINKLKKAQMGNLFVHKDNEGKAKGHHIKNKLEALSHNRKKSKAG